MKERLDTANVLASQRRKIQQQLASYREMMDQLSSAEIPLGGQQMAALLRRITESNKALEALEHRARDAYLAATGKLSSMKTSIHTLMEQEDHPTSHFAAYSRDSLFNVTTFPLGCHCLILAATELPLRWMMSKRGFSRKQIGSVAYWVHPGRASTSDDQHAGSGSYGRGDDSSDVKYDNKFKESRRKGETPVVFVSRFCFCLTSLRHHSVAQL